MKRLMFLALMALPISATYYSFKELEEKRATGVIARAESFLIECAENCSLISSVMARLDQPPYLNPNLRNQLSYYFGDLNQVLRRLSQDSEQLDLFLIFLHANLHDVLKEFDKRGYALENEIYIRKTTTPLIEKLKELKVVLTQLQGIIRMHTRY